MKKILWGTLAGGIFSFFFGWLLYAVVLSGPMESLQGEGMAAITLPDNQMNWLFLIISNLLWGLMLSYIFVTWASISTWKGGLKAGAIICFLIAATYDTSFYSMTTLYTLGGMFFDILVTTVYGAVIGSFIGWIIGKVK
jgi:hypothetical protein